MSRVEGINRNPAGLGAVSVDGVQAQQGAEKVCIKKEETKKQIGKVIDETPPGPRQRLQQFLKRSAGCRKWYTSRS